jgi:hypothetical protein
MGASLRIEAYWQWATSMITLPRPCIVRRIFSQISISFQTRSKNHTRARLQQSWAHESGTGSRLGSSIFALDSPIAQVHPAAFATENLIRIESALIAGTVVTSPHSKVSSSSGRPMASVRKFGVVLVALNYTLKIFGFFFHPDFGKSRLREPRENTDCSIRSPLKCGSRIE